LINEDQHKEAENELIKKNEMMEIEYKELEEELRKVKRKSLPN
jgi:transcription initiation factor TFIID subunit TAF12